MAFPDYPIPTDPEDIKAEQLAKILEHQPGMRLSEAHPLVALIEVLAQYAAEQRQLLVVRGTRGIMKEVGQEVDGVQPIAGAYAAAATTWTLRRPAPPAGYIIPANTRVGWPDPQGGRPVAFATTTDVSIPEGGTEALGVQVVALDIGAARNALAAGPLTLLDGLASVAAVVATTGTSGGVDVETEDAYLARLVDYRRLYGVQLVHAVDYEVAVRQLAGVHRVLALDNYDALTGQSGIEGVLTIAAVDVAGRPLPGDLVALVTSTVTDPGRRLPNVTVHVIDPTYTEVSVDFQVTAAAGADTSAVSSAVHDAVRALLSPATWAGGADSPPVWRDEPTVRYLDVAAAIGRVPDVEHLDVLTVNGGVLDVTLTGPAGLPAPFDAPFATGGPVSTVTGQAL